MYHSFHKRLLAHLLLVGQLLSSCGRPHALQVEPRSVPEEPGSMRALVAPPPFCTTDLLPAHALQGASDSFSGSRVVRCRSVEGYQLALAWTPEGCSAYVTAPHLPHFQPKTLPVYLERGLTPAQLRRRLSDPNPPAVCVVRYPVQKDGTPGIFAYVRIGRVAAVPFVRPALFPGTSIQAYQAYVDPPFSIPLALRPLASTPPWALQSLTTLGAPSLSAHASHAPKLPAVGCSDFRAIEPGSSSRTPWISFGSGRVPASRRENLGSQKAASEATSKVALPIFQHLPQATPTYRSREGHAVTFVACASGKWRSTVVERPLPGFRRTLRHLPVWCAEGYSVEALSTLSTEESSRLVRVALPTAERSGWVSIGFSGLPGGAPYNASEYWMVQCVLQALQTDASDASKAVCKQILQDYWEAISAAYTPQEQKKIVQALRRLQTDAGEQNPLLLLPFCLPKAEAVWEAFRLPLAQQASALRLHWLSQRVKETSKEPFSAELVANLSALPYDVELLEELLQRMAPEPHYPACLRFSAYLQEHKISAAALQKCLDATPRTDSLAPFLAWQARLGTDLLLERYAPTVASHLEAYDAIVCELLQGAATPTYVAHCLTHWEHWKAEKSQTGYPSKLLSLLHHLAPLSDYRLVEKAASFFEGLVQNQGESKWQSAIHRWIAQHTFLEECIPTVAQQSAWMAQHAPDVAYVSNSQRLLADYQAIQEAFKRPSVLPSAPSGAIQSWEEAEIRQWAAAYRNRSSVAPAAERLAVVGQAASLIHGFTPRPVQWLALLALLNPAPHKGRLAQVKTGEGKSILIAMLAVLKALDDQFVDVITTSSELSKREAQVQAPFFALFDRTVSENGARNRSLEDKKMCYQAHIVYGTPSQFQGDLLRTEFSGHDLTRGRTNGFAIVDEADSLLYDQRLQATYLSETLPGMHHLGLPFSALWSHLNRLMRRCIYTQGQYYFAKEDFTKDEKGIRIYSDKPLTDCLVPLGDASGYRSFLETELQQSVAPFLRPLTSSEMAARKAHEALERTAYGLHRTYRSKKAAWQSFLRADPSAYEELRAAKQEYALLKQAAFQHSSALEAAQARLAKAKSSFVRYHAEEGQLHRSACKAAKSAYQAALKDWQKSNWSSRCEPILDLPDYVRAHALAQLPHWIHSMLDAQFVYHKDGQYAIEDGKVIPIDYKHTGIFQRNTTWENGLTQAIQFQHDLSWLPESVSTNALSNIGFFLRYGPRMALLTGTAGDPSTRSFLTQTYPIDLVEVPPYKQRHMAFPSPSGYGCAERSPLVFNSEARWSESVLAHLLEHARSGGAVLVICQYLHQVHALQKALEKRYDAKKVFTYTGALDASAPKAIPKSEAVDGLQVVTTGPEEAPALPKQTLDSGDILLATNIAGRGTDLKPTPGVQAQGGLYVCNTFLSHNQRVEWQNAGRTGRQGAPGSFQFILYHATPADAPSLKAVRNQEEIQALQKAQGEVAGKKREERLFSAFCALEEELMPKATDVRKQHHLERLEASWETNQARSLTPEALERDLCISFERKLASLQANLSSEQKNNPQLLQQLRDAVYEKLYRSITPAQWKQMQTETLLNSFCLAYQGEVPVDVLEAFRKRQPLPLESGSVWAQQYQWGDFERKALQERWGIWFHHYRLDPTPRSEAAALAHFEKTFAKPIREAAAKDKLIVNPYWYVLKGNHARDQLHSTEKALQAYDRAICLDPRYALLAHYNRAHALLMPKQNRCNQASAQAALEECGYQLERYRSEWMHLHQFVASTGFKPTFSTYMGKQIHLLNCLADSVASNQAMLDRIRLKNREAVATRQALGSFFQKSGNQNRLVVDLWADTGLPGLFSLREHPTQSEIVGMAAIGIGQFLSGTFLIVATGGTGGFIGQPLIQSGLSDLWLSCKAMNGQSFEWSDWGLNKAVILGTTALSALLSKVLSKIFSLDSAGELGGFLQHAKVFLSKEAPRDLTQAAWKEGMRKVMLCLGNSMLQKCAYALSEHLIARPLLESFQEKAEASTYEALKAVLTTDPILKRGVVLDCATGSNHWQRIFLQEGLALLETDASVGRTLLEAVAQCTTGQLDAVRNLKKKQEASEACHKAVRELLTANSKEAVEQAVAALRKYKKPTFNVPWCQLAGDAVMALVNKLQINNKILPKFLDAYKKALAGREVELTQAEREHADRQGNRHRLLRRDQFVQLAQEETKLQAEVSNQRSVGCNADSDQPYDSRAKAPTVLEAYQPSSVDHIIRTLSQRIGLRLAASAQRYYGSPVLHHLIEAGTFKLFQDVQDAVDRSQQVYLQGLYSKHYTGKELSNRCDQETMGNPPLSSEAREALLQKLPSTGRELLQKLREQKALTLDHLYMLAGAYGLRIKLYDQQGRFITSTGKAKCPKGLLTFIYGKDPATGKGHYLPYDPLLRAKVAPTGPASCLLDAIAVHLEDASDFLDPTKREQRLLNHINANWELYQQFFQATDVLHKNHQKEFLYEGGYVSEWFNPEYQEARKQGDTAKMTELEAFHNKIDASVAAGIWAASGLSRDFLLGLAAGYAVNQYSDDELRLALIQVGQAAAEYAANTSLGQELRFALEQNDWAAGAKLLIDFLPVIGSCHQAMEAYEAGDYKMTCFFCLCAIVEVVPVVQVVSKSLPVARGLSKALPVARGVLKPHLAKATAAPTAKKLVAGVQKQGTKLGKGAVGKGCAKQGVGGQVKIKNSVGSANYERISKRAPEVLSGKISEGGFLNCAEKYLGKGYKEVSPGRYLSKDGLRQVRYGAHETTGKIHHAHFEAYDKVGGTVVENARVIINPH